MNFIASLNEASALGLADLKKVLTKDKRTSVLMKKGSTFEDVENVVEFVQTIRFFLLNNPSVLEFVKNRNAVKDVMSYELKRLREVRPVKFTEQDFDDLKEFVTVLFREHSYVDRLGLSSALKKELVSWANGNGTYFDLPGWAQRELASVPGLRPTRPVRLYRGLLFSSSSLKERRSYDGSMNVGAGLKFLRSIREGTRIVDLEWDRPSSWTTSRQTAEQFARYSAQSSSYAATMNWLARGTKKIDGDLGFIISSLVQPEDILIDMSKLVTSAHLQHGDEGEFILKPGKYLCRISTKFTQEGEVDPISTSKSEDEKSIVESVKNFVEEIKPQVESLHDLIDSAYGIESLVRDKPSAIKDVTKSNVTKTLVDLATKVKDFYHANLENLNKDVIDNLKIDGNNVYNSIEAIIDFVSATKKSKDGNVSIKTHSVNEYRILISSSIWKTIKDVIDGKKISDSYDNRMLSFAGKIVDFDIPENLYRKNIGEQKKVIQELASKFNSKFDSNASTSDESTMRSVILGAERNIHLIRSLYSIIRNE